MEILIKKALESLGSIVALAINPFKVEGMEKSTGDKVSFGWRP
jgi:hypothetical protein